MVRLIPIPAGEKWLFNNKLALSQVEKGLEDAASGHTKNRGSFAQYIEDDLKDKKDN